MMASKVKPRSCVVDEVFAAVHMFEEPAHEHVGHHGHRWEFRLTDERRTYHSVSAWSQKNLSH